MEIIKQILFFPIVVLAMIIMGFVLLCLDIIEALLDMAPKKKRNKK